MNRTKVNFWVNVERKEKIRRKENIQLIIFAETVYVYLFEKKTFEKKNILSSGDTVE